MNHLRGGLGSVDHDRRAQPAGQIEVFGALPHDLVEGDFLLARPEDLGRSIEEDDQVRPRSQGARPSSKPGRASIANAPAVHQQIVKQRSKKTRVVRMTEGRILAT